MAISHLPQDQFFGSCEIWVRHREHSDAAPILDPHVPTGMFVHNSSVGLEASCF